MMRAVEAGAALAAAVALHLGAFALVPAAGGVSGAGDGGAAAVTVAPADAALADLLESWDRPPETAQTPDAMTPAAQDAPPAVPQADAAPAPAPAPPPPAPRTDTGDPAPSAPPEAPRLPPAEPAPPEAAPLPLPAAAGAAPSPDASAATPRPKPRPKAAAARPPAKASAGVAGQAAAGTGTGGAAGNGGSDTAATADPGRLRDLTAAWGADIRARIERKKTYPADAGGAQGAVVLRLSVAPDGRLSAVTVATSSGHPALDAAALAAVRAAGRFPAAPKGLSAPTRFTLKMSFRR